MPSTHKKVIVRKLDRDSLHGHVGTQFLVDGKLELINTSGNVVGIELSDIKGVYFVRDFNDSESPLRKTFSGRPRTDGIWVRLQFRDNDLIEGMMPNDLMQSMPEGFYIIPPDTRSNTQRIFVPRTALLSATVLGVIGGPVSRKKKAEDARQVAMFGE